MFARMARYDVPPERVPEALEGLRRAGDELRKLSGLAGGYLLADHEGGSVATLTTWTTRDALEASRLRARGLRQEAVDAAGGTVASVVEYEIAGEFGPAAF